MGAWAVCDGVVPRRAVNAPRHHEVAHSIRAGSRLVVIPRAREPTMSFFSKLKSVLYRDSLMGHLHFDGPLSRMGDSGVGLEDTSVSGISEVWMEAGTSFGLNKAFTYWSHSKSPHKFVPVESLLSFNEADLFCFVPSEPVDVRY